MLHDTESSRNLARQRERELIEQAEQDRQARAALDHKRAWSARRRKV